MTKENDYQQEEEERSWDFKKMFITFSVLAFFLIGSYIIFKPYFPTLFDVKVLGISDKKADLQQKLKELDEKAGSEELNKLVDQAKSELSKMTPQNIASTTANLQKIMNDIKAFQDKKKAPQDLFCEYICKR